MSIAIKTMLLLEPKLSRRQVACDTPSSNLLGQELFCACESVFAAVVASELLMVLFSSAFGAGRGLVLLSVVNPDDVGAEVVVLLVALVTVPEELVVVFMEPPEVVMVPVAAVDGVLVPVNGVPVLVDVVLVLSPSGPVPCPSLVAVSLIS